MSQFDLFAAPAAPIPPAPAAVSAPPSTAVATAQQYKAAMLRTRLDRLPREFSALEELYAATLPAFHAAVLSGDRSAQEAASGLLSDVATKLNGGTTFGISGPDGAGTRLARLSQAEDGDVPLWGQRGSFEVDVAGCRVRVQIDGFFGIIGALGFSAHAVEIDRPFISETGYRSFLNHSAEAAPGETVAAFASRVIAEHTSGKLVCIRGLA